MLRKTILSAVLSVATLSGLSLNTTEAAQPPIQQYDHRHEYRGRFEVLYRHRGHWDVYATFRDRDDAQRAAWQLRRQGYDMRIEFEQGGQRHGW